jgi:hypothetical protein
MLTRQRLADKCSAASTEIRVSIKFLLPLLLVSSPALAQSTPQAPATAPATGAATPGDADTKPVCKTVVPTGSRLGGKRECHTKSEWAELLKQRKLDRGIINDRHN